MSGASDDAVRAAHAAWLALTQQLRTKEQLLNAALLIYSEGRGPLPQALMEESRQLRKACNEHFEALLAAMRSQPSS